MSFEEMQARASQRGAESLYESAAGAHGGSPRPRAAPARSVTGPWTNTHRYALRLAAGRRIGPLPPFPYMLRQAREDALALLGDCDVHWEAFGNRPLAFREGEAKRWSGEIGCKERVAIALLALTGRGSPLDDAEVARRRESLRETLRWWRGWRQRGDAAGCRFARMRFEKERRLYRMAIARVRQEMTA